MKRALVIIFALACTVACKKGSFLDDKSTTGFNEENVFADSARTIQFLNRVYADIGFSFNKGRWSSHGNTEQATDDAEYAYSGTAQAAVTLYNGTVSPIYQPSGLSDFWTTPYTNIRRVNLFLSHLPATPLSQGMKTRLEGEARFLRAWFYLNLLSAYGGFPNIQDSVFGINDIINIPRSSFAECVDYIGSELDAAQNMLPQQYEEIDYGRVTAGACLGLKSRLYLYAASPLFNGGSTSTDAELTKLVSYPTYNVSYWQKAADAAQAVINSGNYSLFVDNTTKPGYGFYKVFLTRVNSEYIFAQYRPANKDMEGFYNPPSRGGAKNSQPTQNLAESFPMKNGKAITDNTSGFVATNPYAGRDPRFNYSIIFNESRYANSSNAQAVVYTYLNAPQDGMPATGTGYYSRKMCDSTIANNGSSGNTERAWPLMRYAEILLNYAEAINETGQPSLAYDKLRQIRQRAGIDAGANGLYGMKANMTQDEMRQFIRNERRIELSFEDHRWNDIRRWKIAMVTNNAYNNCMQITRAANGTYTYQVVPSIRRHNFRNEMYLMPIPNDEIRKMPAMLQNPGW